MSNHSFDDPNTTVEPLNDGSFLVKPRSNTGQIRLQRFPGDASVVLDLTKPQTNHVHKITGTVAEIAISIAGKNNKLTLLNASAKVLTLQASGEFQGHADLEVEFDSSDVLTLQVEGITARLKGSPDFDHLLLRNAECHGAKALRSTIYGCSKFDGKAEEINVAVDQDTSHDMNGPVITAGASTLLRLDSNSKCTVIGSGAFQSILPGANCHIHLGLFDSQANTKTEAKLQCETIEPANTPLRIHLQNQNLTVSNRIENTTLIGPGELGLEAATASCLEAQEQVRLSATPGSSLEKIHGVFVVRSIKGSHLKGDENPEKVLRLTTTTGTSIDAFQNSIIEGFEPDLTISGHKLLSALGPARIVNPSVTELVSRCVADENDIHSGIEILDRLCQEKSTQGTIKTQVAYASAINRMRTASSRFEQYLLKVYSLLSFSQRPGRPFAAWMLVIFLSAIAIGVHDLALIEEAETGHFGYLKTVSKLCETGGIKKAWMSFDAQRLGSIVVSLIAEPFNLLQVRTGQEHSVIPWSGAALSFQRLFLAIPFAALLVSIIRITRVVMK